MKIMKIMKILILIYKKIIILMPIINPQVVIYMLITQVIFFNKFFIMISFIYKNLTIIIMHLKI